ncbi:hypothetical protein BJ742DRAFT_741959 [Cladochytrium replicatum]|nr:hypothetical protein BJ742DRAFT_741959 [Cladochytrium replicatum]
MPRTICPLPSRMIQHASQALRSLPMPMARSMIQSFRGETQLGGAATVKSSYWDATGKSHNTGTIEIDHGGVVGMTELLAMKHLSKLFLNIKRVLLSLPRSWDWELHREDENLLAYQDVDDVDDHDQDQRIIGALDTHKHIQQRERITRAGETYLESIKWALNLPARSLSLNSRIRCRFDNGIDKELMEKKFRKISADVEAHMLRAFTALQAKNTRLMVLVGQQKAINSLEYEIKLNKVHIWIAREWPRRSQTRGNLCDANKDSRRAVALHGLFAALATVIQQYTGAIVIIVHNSEFTFCSERWLVGNGRVSAEGLPNGHSEPIYKEQLMLRQEEEDAFITWMQSIAIIQNTLIGATLTIQ